jgi:hypothetical protein
VIKAVRATRQGICFICQSKIIRREWIVALAGGYAHFYCYSSVKY